MTTPERGQFDTYIATAISPLEAYTYDSLEAAIALREELKNDYEEDVEGFLWALHEATDSSFIAHLYERELDVQLEYGLNRPAEYIEDHGYINSGFVLGLEIARHTIGDQDYEIYMVEAFKRNLNDRIEDAGGDQQLLVDSFIRLGYDWYHYRDDNGLGLVRSVPAYDNPHEPLVDTFINGLGIRQECYKELFSAGFGLASYLGQSAYRLSHEIIE